MKTFDLGPVTAYAIAVKNGFQGTEKEWIESLGGKVELDTTLTKAGTAADAKAVGDALANVKSGANFLLALSTSEDDAQANSNAITAAIAEHKHVVLQRGDYPVKPGIVVESGKLDMNGAHLYTVDYKSETPLVYLKGESPEICNGDLEGSYDLADNEEGYSFFEKECLIRPEGVNDAYIHHMKLHHNWGYCISPGQVVESVYVSSGTRNSANEWTFITEKLSIPEGYKYVTAAGGIGYNYIISVSGVTYVFYDADGAEITKHTGCVPRRRATIPDGAKTVAIITALESDVFVPYYAYFTNYTETLTVEDCDFYNFHSLGMANMPGPTTVTRCTFVEGGKPRSGVYGTFRATTGGIDIEDVQTPEFIMSDCWSRDCAKLLMFGGYKGVVTNCFGNAVGVYRGWQCDFANCNVTELYTMGTRCRISTNGVHADSVDIKPENRNDVQGDISTNGIPKNPSLDCFDRFIVKLVSATGGGALSGRLNGRIEVVSPTGFKHSGISSEKGSRLEIDTTIVPENNGNYYGAQNVNGDTYGLMSNTPIWPNGFTIHDSVFNIGAQMSAYGWADAGYSGGFEDCVFNLTGATFFRLFAKSPSEAVELTFDNCTINNADNYLFNFVPFAGSKITFKNCTIADESKLFNGDTDNITIEIVSGDGDSLMLDRSLTVDGAAADAKATGEALATLGEKIGAIGSSLPKFELLLSHTVTEDEIAAAPTGFMFDTTDIPNLNDYNAFVLNIRSADGSTITFSKWVRLAINGAHLGNICGTSANPINTYTATAHRMCGVWVSSDAYDPKNTRISMFEPIHAYAAKTSTLSAAEEVTSIGFTSYASDFGAVAGMIVEIYGAR